MNVGAGFEPSFANKLANVNLEHHSRVCHRATHLAEVTRISTTHEVMNPLRRKD